jgi:hypothetical protein
MDDSDHVGEGTAWQTIPGLTAEQWNAVGLAAAPIWVIATAIALSMRNAPQSAFPIVITIVGICFLSAGVIGLAVWRMKRKAIRERAAGYTTQAGHAEVPRVDSRSRRVIRAAGIRDLSRDELRAARVRVRTMPQASA